MTVRLHLKYPIPYQLVIKRFFDVELDHGFLNNIESFGPNYAFRIDKNLVVLKDNVAAFERIEG